MSKRALKLIQENKKTKSTTLDLGKCGLTQVPDAIGELIWLEELILSDEWGEYDFEKKRWKQKYSRNHGGRNKIEILPPTLPFLILLKKLIFNNSGISELWPIAGLANLQLLDCYNTEISDLKPIVHLIKNGAKITWKEWADINEFSFKDCPLVYPPVEIVKQGTAAILRYFEQIAAQDGTEKLFEAKIIIVGEGETGKTTLFEKMKDENHDPVKKPTGETHGINIYEGMSLHHPSLGERHVAANLWDFGGQDLQYMTHQFFLTPRALYVLLINARSESPNLAYWFKIISLLGKESEDSSEKVPLLLVFNKRLGGTGKTPE